MKNNLRVKSKVLRYNLKRATSWSAYAVAALVLIAVVQWMMVRAFPDWNAETRASVWVAIGTIFLALATCLSILETRAVVRAEDRRMQNALSPLLIIHGPQLTDQGTVECSIH